MSQHKKRPDPRAIEREPPAVEFLTVGWMLSVMTTLLCELGLIAVRGYLLLATDESPKIELLAGMLLFASVVVGLISLALAAAVVRGRRVPPPTGVLVISLVIGSLPLATVLINWVRQSTLA